VTIPSNRQAAAEMPTPTVPDFQQRPARPYAAIRLRVPRNDIAVVVPPLWPEVVAWLASHGLEATGAPFIRYRVIGRNALTDIEAGVPVTK
jgi:hypothetical protein